VRRCRRKQLGHSLERRPVRPGYFASKRKEPPPADAPTTCAALQSRQHRSCTRGEIRQRRRSEQGEVNECMGLELGGRQRQRQRQRQRGRHTTTHSVSRSTRSTSHCMTCRARLGTRHAAFTCSGPAKVDMGAKPLPLTSKHLTHRHPSSLVAPSQAQSLASCALTSQQPRHEQQRTAGSCQRPVAV
jgi:hypothetical protein